MTVIVQGEVSAVTQAVESAIAKAVITPCASAVIANPHEETVRIVEKSASRLKKR